MTEITSLQLKLLIIGEPNSGKTSLVRRYCNGIFDESYRATIGVDFAVKFLEYPFEQYQDIELRLWDIAGQDKYINFTRVYYSGAHGAIVVYDITNDNNIDKWKKQLDSICIFEDKNIHLPCMLVGNKIDLINKDDIDTYISRNENYKNELKFDDCMLISVKENTNIDQLFDNMIKLILSKIEIFKKENDENIVLLDNKEENLSENKKCCTMI